MPLHSDLMSALGASFGTLAAFTGFWFIGRVVPGRPFWQYPLIGWAIVYVIALVAAVLAIGNLNLVLALAGVLAVGGVIWRRPVFARHPLALYVAALPLMGLGVLTPPLFWDSFAHWLPNSVYLYQFDHFARTPLGTFYSLHPTYPDALPLVIYIASRVTGFFTELAGNVTNVVLLLVALGCVLRLLRECWPGEPPPMAAMVAIAFCIAVPANPAIEVQYYWSALADPALAVLTLVMIIECCRLMVNEPDSPAGPALLFLFLLGVLVSGLKPNACLLAAALAPSAAFIGLIHRVPVRRWLLPAAAILGGAVLGAGLWQLYLNKYLALPDQFAVKPLSQWRFDLVPDLLMAVLSQFEANVKLTLVLSASLIAGVVTLISRSFIENRTMRLALGLATVALILHVATLFAAYLGGGFREWEIKSAESFLRYVAHAGYALCAIGLTVLVLTLGPRLLSAAKGFSPRAVTVVCCLGAGALFLLTTVRETVLLESLAQDRADRRARARQAFDQLGAGSRAAVAAAKWTFGFMRFEISSQLRGTPPRIEDFIVLFDGEQADCNASRRIDGWLNNPAIDTILILDADRYVARCMPGTAPSRVWKRSTGTWQVLD